MTSEPDFATLAAQLRQKEHDAGQHSVGPVARFAPRDCRACWPGGPPPFTGYEQPEQRTDGARVRRGGSAKPMAGLVDYWRGRFKVDQPPVPEVPVYCQTCKDHGWVRKDIHAEHAGTGADAPPRDSSAPEQARPCPQCVAHPDFGKVQACPTCRPPSVLLEEAVRREWKDAPRAMQRYSLQTLAARSPEHARFAARLRLWLRDTSEPPPDLILYGKIGTGKTGAAASLARAYMEELHKPAIVAVITDLLTRLRSTYSGEGDEKHEIDKLKYVDLLVLDDLGKEQHTGWAASRLFEVLNFRYNDERRTIVTCNEDPITLGLSLGMEAEIQRLLERTRGQTWSLDCSNLPDRLELLATTRNGAAAF